jgi:hypothetical protein
LNVKLNIISKECNITININESKINASFNDKFKPINENGIFYFSSGNTNKNNWFNTVKQESIYLNSTITTAKNLIVCKEIGDTLQAYYGKLFMNSLIVEKRKEVCLFTCDKKLVMRCQLLELPVIYTSSFTRNENKQISIYEAPNMNTFEKDMKNYYKTYINNINNSIIKSINTLLMNGWYNSRQKEKVEISSQLRAILQEICKLIRERMFAFDYMNMQYMNISDFNYFSNYYRALEIIDDSQFTFKTVPDYLFVHVFSDDKPILANLKKALLTGGSGYLKNIYLYTFNNSIHNFTKLDEEIPEDDLSSYYSNDILIKNTMFTRLKILFPEKSDAEICYNVSDLFSLIHLYYTYTGSFLYSKEFLAGLIELVKNVSILPDYPDFLTFYNSYVEESEMISIPNLDNYIHEFELCLKRVQGKNMRINIVPVVRTRKHNLIKARRTYRKLKV